MRHHDFQAEKGYFWVLFDLQLCYLHSQTGKTRVPYEALVYADQNTLKGSMHL